MPCSRFSKQELFHLRNNIPVAEVIKILDIPFKISEGYTRFLCPVCKEFNTSVNPKTNLARCFLCKKNYNPIDMVITVKNLTFIESVKYLQSLSYKSSPTTTASSEKPNKNAQTLISIKDILNTSGISVKAQPDKSEQQSDKQNYRELQEKISLLEQQIKNLTTQFSLIEQKILKS
jgi:DNA primase